jgi:hypothetical protein
VTALLRAEWIRYRRKIDLWVMVVGLLTFGIVGFVNGYRNDVTDPPLMSEAQIRQMITDSSVFDGFTQAEIDAQIDQSVRDFQASQEADRLGHEAQQAISLQKYDVAQAPLTVLGFGFGPLVAAFLIGTLIVGDEFRHSTIRAALLAASDRRRFLVARLATIAVITVGLFGAVLALALLLSLGLHLVGAELPPPTVAIDPGSAAGLVVVQILVVFAAVALGVALTLLFRSGAVPLLVVLIYVFVERFLANMPVFADREPLAGLQQGFFTEAAQRLITTYAQRTNAGTFEVSLNDSPALLPLWTSAVIVVAWLTLFLLIADRRLRTMDIVE